MVQTYGHLQASTSASASGSGSGPSSESLPPPTAPPQQVKRRRYARRSCLTCRSKKTRCELPDEQVASSHDALPVYKACHRCRALDIPCVVWDGDRKRKPRISNSTALPPITQQLSHAPPSPVYPRDPHSSYGPRRDSTSYSNDAPQRSSYHDAAAYSTDQSYVHRDWHPSSSPNRSTNRRADLYERHRYPPEPGPPPTSDSPSTTITNATAASANTSASSSSKAPAGNPHYDAALWLDFKSSEARKRKLLSHDHLFANQFLHSPLVTLNRFITKFPSFSRLLRPEMDRSFDGQLSSLLTDENIHMLQAHHPLMVMWHPHIPSLHSLRTAYHERPKPSTSLLLASVCLVASKIAGKRHLAKHFAFHVDRIGLQVLISAPKELHAAQAFELLLSHEPSLIGASVDPSSPVNNDSAIFGQSLHSSAIAIAEAIGLDLVMSQNPLDGNNDTNDKEGDDRIRWQLQRFSLWCSLSIWRSKFTFLNSVIRPHDFSRLRHDAHLAISLVEKLRPPHGDASTEVLSDDIMFKAGIIGLAHRAIQVADFHTWLAQLETLIHSRSIFSDLEVRREINSRVDSNMASLKDLKEAKRLKLWTLGNLHSIKFLDRWIDLEFECDWTFIWQLYMRMVLPYSQAGSTALDVSHNIGKDVSLFRFMFGTAQRTYLSTESTLAALAAVPRFEGEGLEQTGLPQLLTCGYVLFISVMLMEGVSFTTFGSHDAAMREIMFALVLSQLADRLCGPAQSGGESLEKLVSSMLVQMSRRLNDAEYIKVTRSNKASESMQGTSDNSAISDGHSSAMPAQAPHLRQPVSDSSPGSNPISTPSEGWQDTSKAGPQQGGSNVHLQSMLPTSTTMFPASAAPTDPLSADNMARIIDQILDWNYLPPMNGAHLGGGM